MPRTSSGLLMYRVRDGRTQVLLVHPGGPFFRHKDAGAWTIPKGEAADGEDLLACARREFAEELGIEAQGDFRPLSAIRQKGGKTVHAWCLAGDCDPSALRSNTFEMEWPPRSGNRQTFPEIDRAEFFDLAIARDKINPAQADFLDQVERIRQSEDR